MTTLDRAAAGRPAPPRAWRTRGGRRRLVGARPHLEPDHLTSLYIPALGAARPSRRVEWRSSVDLDGHPARAAARGTASRRMHPSCRIWSRSPTRSSTRWRPSLRRRRPGRRRRLTPAHLEEELGDLLFQIVFHARLADEEGQFDLADVARGVHDKLVHRHPHVFGDVDAATRRAGGHELGGDQEEEKGRTSVTEGIPRACPALCSRPNWPARRVPSAWSRTTPRGQAARRAGGVDPRAEGRPTAGRRSACRCDGGDLERHWASCSSPCANLRSGSASMPSRRCATGAALPRRSVRAEGVPEDHGGQPLTLVPGVPPGGTAKERCREHH